MAEYPALPLFTDAYLADTRHLSTIQHGAYLLMLIVAWRSPDCALPDDDTYLARITGMDKRTWLANKVTLLQFWRLSDKQKWEQARLKDERNYVEQKRNKNVAAGKSSALKRNNRGSASVQPESNQNPTPTPTPIIKQKKKESSSATHLPFDQLPSEWEKWTLEDRGWPREIIADVWVQFSDYWKDGKGRNTKRKDWVPTWKQWCRKEKINNGDYNATVSRDTKQNSRKSNYLTEADRLCEQYDAEANAREQEGFGAIIEQNMRVAEIIWEDSSGT